jgi:flagellar motor component MotA
MTNADDALERMQQRAGEVFLKQHEEKHEDEKDRVDAWRVGHRDKHDAEQEALAAALAAHKELHEAHSTAHSDRHIAEQQAVRAATTAMDRRLDEMNNFREQLRDQASTFARKEMVDSVETQASRQYEELRALIQTEREERRATEGVKRGMSSTTAIIVTAIGVVGTVLGIIIVGANLITGTP